MKIKREIVIFFNFVGFLKFWSKNTCFLFLYRGLTCVMHGGHSQYEFSLGSYNIISVSMSTLEKF